MSYLETLIKDVNSTHSNMGELVALLQVAVKAHKMVLVVSPSGCGKSTAMSYVGKNIPNSHMPTSLSIASLANKIDLFDGFRSVIVIDDVATIQTTYARNATITALSALCYSHRVQPSMANFDFAIENFYGSAFVGIQPVLLRDLMLSPEWDASIQDKVLRYYHLHRPTNPFINLPTAKIELGIDIEEIKNFQIDKNDKHWQKLVSIGDSQWSKARTEEHLTDMLKAVACLDYRKYICTEDYDLLARLLKPMLIENLVVNKTELEGDRMLDNTLLALLVEYYSYDGEFLLAHIMRDFKIQMHQAYNIMRNQKQNWQQITKSPTSYKPTDKLLAILKNYNLELQTKML